MHTDTSNVVIAGRDRQSLEFLCSVVSTSLRCQPKLQHITNGHCDPLHNHPETPTLLVLDLAADWREQLNSLCSRPAAARPQLLVIGPGANAEAMRLSMRAGACDYLPTPVSPADLQQALALIQLDSNDAEGAAEWTSVIGTTGGVGTSTVALNLAALMSKDENTLLVDLDLQSASLSGYLDQEPRYTILDAANSVGELDATALSGYVCATKPGVNLLASPGALILPEQFDNASIAQLYQLISQSYSRVVVDVPRLLNHVSIEALSVSQRIIVVVEPSIASLRDATRLHSVLVNDLELSESQIMFLLNRVSRHDAITPAQVKKNLGQGHLLTIANDYRGVSESLNIGSPLVGHNRGSQARRDLCQLYAEITGRKESRPRLMQSLSGLFGSQR